MAQAGAAGTSSSGQKALRSTDSPWDWLGEAVGIYRRQFLISLGYGLLFVAIGYGLFGVLAASGLASVIPIAIGAFALVGPLMATGLYAVARADDEGRRATIRETLLPRAASPTQIAYLGVILLVAVLFWTIIAAALFAIFHASGLSSLSEFAAFALTTPRGIAMLAIGSILGGLMAFGIFAMTAFSIPMLMDRHVDFATAIGASIEAVKRHPRTMLLWAWLIALSLFVGAATFLLGFAVLFPLLGYATWVGYRSTFGSTGQ
ncbi:DUF2189 domain-containing protein [Parvularcula lutaonensis]|uniref:DUF2189 domain-containing protein n=1 Tax=Parvularcula lutaonensis TaxID=491923 RepID=A0ABV7MAH4_9PROT|nr:DUF2189 domain-containing protein [Parvularcula lutaonensis]GGY45582.1 hypothetical protein GCM10007148_13240 [Parvularcula lutaonensis]